MRVYYQKQKVQKNNLFPRLVEQGLRLCLWLCEQRKRGRKHNDRKQKKKYKKICLDTLDWRFFSKEFAFKTPLMTNLEKEKARCIRFNHRKKKKYDRVPTHIENCMKFGHFDWVVQDHIAPGKRFSSNSALIETPQLEKSAKIDDNGSDGCGGGRRNVDEQKLQLTNAKIIRQKWSISRRSANNQNSLVKF